MRTILVPKARVLYWENGAVANLADTNYVSTTAYTLPAGTLVTNGDRLIFEANFSFNATAATKTYNINIGYTSFAADATGFTGGSNIMTHSTTGTSISIYSRAVVTRTSATTGNTFEFTMTSGAAVQSVLYGAINLTWANNLLIAADTKSSVGNAGITTIHEFCVTLFPR